MKKTLKKSESKSLTSSSSQIDEKITRTSRRDTAKIETVKSPARSAQITTTTVNRSTRRSSPVSYKEFFDATHNERRSPSRKITTRAPSPSRKIATRAPSPSRKKSPARKISARNSIREERHDYTKTITSDTKKSPSRKSPSRIPTKVDRKKSEEEKIYDLDTDSDSQEMLMREKPKATVRGRSRTITNDKQKDKISASGDDQYCRESITTRRSLRLSQQNDNERIVHLKDTEILRSNLIEYSDDDEKEIVCLLPQQKQTTEFGGTLGVMLFTLLLPSIIIGINMICNKNGCNWTSLNHVPKQLNDYVDSITFLSFFAFNIVLALLNVVPFGGRKITGLLNKHGKLEYRTNGLLIMIVILAVSIGLEYCDIQVYNFIYENYLKIAVSCVLFSVILSVFVYVRSFYVPMSALNPHIVYNSNLYNFFMGREIHPRFFGILDGKLFLFRYLELGVLLSNLAFLYQYTGANFDISQIFDPRNINETLYTCCFMQIITVLDNIYFEDVFLTSYEIQTEGCGYMMAMGYYGVPIMFASISKYLLEDDVRLSPSLLLGQLLIFIVGTTIKRLADIQKHSFRMNPYSNAVSHLKSIQTGIGKKLIVSGYWGIVRHPNYLGQMLVLLSFIPFVLHAPHVTLLIGNILLLIHRIYRDDRRCREKYGTSWDKYCEQVKCVLIPKIY